jgi:hypothetical protein
MKMRSHISLRVGTCVPLCLAIFALVAGFGRSEVAGQGRGGGPPVPAGTARSMAPFDLTGTWVSIVQEDWRWRMVTPQRGDVSSIPVNAEGRKVAANWDLAADNASGDQCKAYGVGGIMRQPGRVRISWEDDQTLKLEFDAGTQTRLLHFDGTRQPPSAATLQGFTVAQWVGPGVGRGGATTGDGRVDPRVTGGGRETGVPGGGGRGLRGSPPPRQQAQINTGGHIAAVTTHFRDGYLRQNGVPYSGQARITEYITRLPTHPNGDDWLHVVTIVDDPRYLTQPFYTSTSLRREPNDANFKPTPCATAPPLPVRAPGE